jgi:hypothetical protein
MMAELFGMPVPDLPEGCTPMAAVVIVKVLDVDGKPGEFPYNICSRITPDLSVWEALGMAEWMRLRAQDQLRAIGGGG